MQAPVSLAGVRRGFAARDRAGIGDGLQPIVAGGAADGGARAKLAPSRRRIEGAGGLANRATHVAMDGLAAIAAVGTPADCLPILQIAQCWDALSKGGW